MEVYQPTSPVSSTARSLPEEQVALSQSDIRKSRLLTSLYDILQSSVAQQ